MKQQTYIFRTLLFLSLTLGAPYLLAAQETETPSTSATATSEGSDAPSTPATVTSESPETSPAAPEAPSLEDQIAEVEAAIQEVDADLAELEAQPVEEGQPPNPAIDFLRQKKVLLERRRSALARSRELRDQLQPAKVDVADEPGAAEESAEPDATPTIQDFDVLLDQREAAERQLAVAKGAVEAQEAAVKRAEARVDEADRERRAVEEIADTPAAEALQARWKATLAELRVAVARAQLSVTELELALAERGLAEVNAEVQEARSKVAFTPEALEERLAEIETQRADLNSQLAELYDLLDRHQQQLERAQASLAQAAEEEKPLAGERVTTAERELRASRQGELYVQQRLENLTVEEAAWRRRFALFQPDRPDDLRTQWNETAAQLQDIQSDVALVEPVLRNVLSSALELQRRLDNNDLNGGLRPLLDARLAALERHAGYGRDYLAALSRQEKLLVRLEGALRGRYESEGVQALYASLRKGVKEAWSYELFEYQDKAYRVAGLTYACATFLAVLLFLLFLRKTIRLWWARVLKRFEGTSRSLVLDLGLTLINNTSTIVMLIIAFWASSWFLPLEWLDNNRNGIVKLAIYLQLAIYATNWLSRSLDRTKARLLKEDPSSVTAYGLLSFFGRFVIWVMFFLLALMALGQPITPLIASLGVGGIAVAFAMQNILADVFNSVAIVLDKPFVVGDFIKVGETIGVVEHIGIKTTRIRALGGEQISVSNSDLLGSRIQNYKRMEERRVVFHLGVTYQTPSEKLRAIPDMVREAIEAQDCVRYDRVHFQTFGDFALIYECVYFVLTNDYKIFMDTQQAVNLILYERFENKGIEFAYPTQTLFLQREGGDSSREPGQQ